MVSFVKRLHCTYNTTVCDSSVTRQIHILATNFILWLLILSTPRPYSYWLPYFSHISQSVYFLILGNPCYVYVPYIYTFCRKSVFSPWCQFQSPVPHWYKGSGRLHPQVDWLLVIYIHNNYIQCIVDWENRRSYILILFIALLDNIFLKFRQQSVIHSCLNKHFSFWLNV